MHFLYDHLNKTSSEYLRKRIYGRLLPVYLWRIVVLGILFSISSSVPLFWLLAYGCNCRNRSSFGRNRHLNSWTIEQAFGLGEERRHVHFDRAMNFDQIYLQS